MAEFITYFFKRNPELSSALSALDVQYRFEYSGNNGAKLPFSSLAVLKLYSGDLEPIIERFIEGKIDKASFIDELKPLIGNYYSV